MDYLEIGCTPASEDCVQVDSNKDYMPAMRADAKRYVEMLKLRFPNCGAVKLCIKSNSHDFGDYLDVRLKYYTAEGENQALFIERNLPERWTDAEVLTYVPEEVDDSVDDPRDEFSQFEEDWAL